MLSLGSIHSIAKNVFLTRMLCGERPSYGHPDPRPAISISSCLRSLLPAEQASSPSLMEQTFTLLHPSLPSPLLEELLYLTVRVPILCDVSVPDSFSLF